MAKTTKDITGAPFPVPVILATTWSADGPPNIITLAWAGVVCSSPLMIGVAIRPSRYSHTLLEHKPELVINVPGRDQLEKTDMCGTVSGRDTDKFAQTGWTAVPGTKVAAPLIQECPINLECRVSQKLALGTHDLFVCEVVLTHVDEETLDESGRIDFGRFAPFSYAGMDYWALDRKIGHYGYSKRST